MNSPEDYVTHALGIEQLFDQLCDKGVSDDIMNITDINGISHKFDHVPWSKPCLSAQFLEELYPLFT